MLITTITTISCVIVPRTKKRAKGFIQSRRGLCRNLFIFFAYVGSFEPESVNLHRRHLQTSFPQSMKEPFHFTPSIIASLMWLEKYVIFGCFSELDVLHYFFSKTVTSKASVHLEGKMIFFWNLRNVNDFVIKFLFRSFFLKTRISEISIVIELKKEQFATLSGNQNFNQRRYFGTDC